jgi:hypothetical protein
MQQTIHEPLNIATLLYQFPFLNIACELQLRDHYFKDENGRLFGRGQTQIYFGLRNLSL